jgi:hypothetical protein
LTYFLTYLPTEISTYILIYFPTYLPTYLVQLIFLLILYDIDESPCRRCKAGQKELFNVDGFEFKTQQEIIDHWEMWGKGEGIVKLLLNNNTNFSS